MGTTPSIRRPWVLAVGAAVATAAIVPAAQAANFAISSSTTCPGLTTSVSGFKRCYTYNSLSTASWDAATSTVGSNAANVLNLSVGDTIQSLDAEMGHPTSFCAAGATATTPAGFNWTCADFKIGATTPGETRQPGYSSFGTGAPATLTTAASTASFETPGTYYFWCKSGLHPADGMFGKIVVTASSGGGSSPGGSSPGGSSPGASSPGASSPGGSASGGSGSGGSSATVATALTITVRKTSRSVIFSGTATGLSNTSVKVQRSRGAKWMTVKSGRIGVGTWSVSVPKKKAKAGIFRAISGTTTSPTVQV